MAHGYFNHSESCQFEFLGHLDTDDTASGFQRNPFEDVAPEEPEVAIDIANRKSKCPAHRAAVGEADPDSIPCIGAFDLVAVDEIDIRPELCEQVVKLAH